MPRLFMCVLQAVNLNPNPTSEKITTLKLVNGRSHRWAWQQSLKKVQLKCMHAKHFFHYRYSVMCMQYLCFVCAVV